MGKFTHFQFLQEETAFILESLEKIGKNSYVGQSLVNFYDSLFYGSFLYEGAGKFDVFLSNQVGSLFGKLLMIVVGSLERNREITNQLTGKKTNLFTKSWVPKAFLRLLLIANKRLSLQVIMAMPAVKLRTM
jgi:hypothetical protein